MIELTVYTRPGCHLCDEMIEELGPLLGECACLSIVDISEDQKLHDRYFLEIPVLKHGDEEISRYHLDRDRLANLLRAEQ